MQPTLLSNFNLFFDFLLSISIQATIIQINVYKLNSVTLLFKKCSHFTRILLMVIQFFGGSILMVPLIPSFSSTLVFCPKLILTLHCLWHLSPLLYSITFISLGPHDSSSLPLLLDVTDYLKWNRFLFSICWINEWLPCIYAISPFVIHPYISFIGR